MVFAGTVGRHDHLIVLQHLPAIGLVLLEAGTRHDHTGRLAVTVLHVTVPHHTVIVSLLALAVLVVNLDDARRRLLAAGGAQSHELSWFWIMQL